MNFVIIDAVENGSVNLAKFKPLMEALVGDLRHESGYEKLEVARSEQKRAEAARYLPELIKTA